MASRLLPLVVLFCLLASAAAAFPPAPDDLIPIDSAVRIATLDNGLTYYIRANQKPENLAEIRLVVNAGSLLEEDDQQGLAHFLEHMAFNGTEHFAGNDLIAFLESIGSKFGPDINAFTSFDETVYLLEIPTDKEDLLDQGLLVLRDWAGGMTIDPEEVEKERGVILEEWRLGRGAGQRVRQVQWPVLFKGSLYAERLPIGKVEVIEQAPAQRLRDYYERWYQPHLMAVVAVGDFDPDSVETMIRDRFGDLPAPASPSVRPVPEVPRHDETLASAATDEELQFTQVSLTFKHPRRDIERVKDMRGALVTSLFSNMLNARFTEISQQPDAPFLFAGSGAGSAARSVDMFQVFAMTPEGELEKGLDALLTEIARVRAHGFGKGEYERGRARFKASLEQMYNERDKTESASYAREYMGHFLDKEPIAGIVYEHEVTLALLEDIPPAEVNAAVGRLVHEDNMVILASGPEKDGVSLPSEDMLLARVLNARGSEPPAYVDSVSAEGLLRTEPVPGTVTARRTREDLGVTILDLDNGMKVWLKPTDFKNDQILFGTRVPGGMSLADSNDFASAALATAYVREAGYGGWTPTELRKMLAGKTASAAPRIGNFDQGVSGSATPADLETALQVMYMILTNPTDREEAFTVLTDRYRSVLENRFAVPETHFSDAAAAMNFQNHYMFRPPSVEWLDRAEREKAMEFYRARMKQVRGCRFYFVGAFDPVEIEPLILRYIGSLPASESPPPEVRDVGLRFPEGVQERRVRAGTEPKARVMITWPGLTNMEEMEIFRLRMAGDLLQIRLRELLREDLGSTYSVSVSSTHLRWYPEYATTSISFGCAPENVDRLVATVFEEIERFKRDGPEPDEVETVRELERRALEKSLKENGYWVSSFVTLQSLGWDPGRILARHERLDSLTGPDMQDVMNRYYPTDNHTTIMLLPESD